MTNQEEWNEILDNLLSHAKTEYKSTREYEYRKQRREYIDEFLISDLTDDQKNSVDEFLLEFDADAERETRLIYQRGFLDCVRLLKYLGVLA